MATYTASYVAGHVAHLALPDGHAATCRYAACGQNAADVLVQPLAGEAVGRYAVAHHAAQLLARLEHR